MTSRHVLFLLICALALVVGLWTCTPLQAVAIVRYGGYWSVAVSTVCFLFCLLRSLRGVRLAASRSSTWLSIAFVIVGCTAFMHVHEPHEFKIVADEVVLSLTAKEMHFSRDASVVVRGYEYAGNFVPFVNYVDKRPLLFPFLLSTVHDLTGFRVDNVFALNAVLSVLLVALMLLIGRRIGGLGGGVAAVLLLITIPLVAQNACSAGFELLNLVMILLTVWLGMRAGEVPESDDRLSAFVLSGVLLAQVRYESVLFIAPVGASVLYLWWKTKSIRLPWALLLAPLLLIVCPLQYNVFKVSRGTWQLNDVAGADSPFGLKYFYDNVGHALNFFLCTDGSQPNSILVGVLGSLAVGFFVLLVYKKHRDYFFIQPVEAIFCIFIIGLLAHTFLMLCYFWGHWDNPIIRRLSLPAHLLLVLATVFVWPHAVAHRNRWKILGAVAAVYLAAFTIPSNAMHRFTQQNFAARTVSWLDDFIRTLGDRSALAIDKNAGLVWILHGKSSVTVQSIAGRPEALLAHFRNHSFQDVFIVQRASPDFNTGQRYFDAADDLGDALQLQLVEERAFAPLYLVRLSRVVAIDEAKLMAWAKKRQTGAVVSEPAQSQSTQIPLSGTASDQESQLLTWLRQLP